MDLESLGDQTTAPRDVLHWGWWAGGAAVLVMVIVGVCWGGYVWFQREKLAIPAKAYPIKVTAEQWQWRFTYPNGYSNAVLHVPAGQAVQLEVTSTDVVHGLYIPDFGVQTDAIPGQVKRVWFRANAGTHGLYCSVVCGAGHVDMHTKVIAQRPQAFQAWLERVSARTHDSTSPISLGRQVWANNCTMCHSVDGSAGPAPTWKGLWASEVKLASGMTVKADRAYIRRSIEQPDSQVVAGYQPIMPSFAGKLNRNQLAGVIAYLKSLSASGK